MNTITQIENALKAINQATFQSLVNHLLYLQGNKYIGAPGAVVGKDKTSKGSPDSFFINDNNGMYIFVECTTHEKLGKSKSFMEKLLKDVDHCFDVGGTKINKDKIEKIILACNEKISAEDYNSLSTKVKAHNPTTKFEILNIQNLPLLIYDFSKLSEEYLNVQIVKGEIYTLTEFLLKTTKGLQPSLTNEFIGREEEIKKCTDALLRYDRLLLSGGAGVGKSKLAVQVLEEFSKDGYTPIVIQSSAVPLWDDFNHFFQAGKNYLVLFDDANKSIQNLNYLLSIIDKQKAFSIKVIVTSRDYVKKQVSHLLSEHSYEEVIISEFTDEEITKIIEAALPNLKYHPDIKRKIVDLAKGNARVALMATYSVIPDAETNYLSSPVLLYEQYFKKISGEIGIFDNPIILKSLAIVSFFGVLDKNNETLKQILLDNFAINWNELWSAIMELHNHEILDVYANEIVKISDQVLATYAFYKCFIDDKSVVINYAHWIIIFMNNYSHRIRATLIDANNTFVYYHVKDLVQPHLNEVLKQISTNEDLYTFYDLFWFYKGRECLLYLKKWINGLEQENIPEILKFDFVHNDYSKASKHFELLKGFWNHPNELLKPSIEFTLELLAKQPSRLPETLKFITEDFKYKLEDREQGYLRQNIILDVLLNENLPYNQRMFANGIFLNLALSLLGWHYTEFASTKAMAFTIYNFDLYKSDELMKLRKFILNQVYHLFDHNNKQFKKILDKIIYPDGDMDKSIYADELPIYEKIISNKLDTNQYTDCKFVKTLAEHITKAGQSYPENWNSFIESDIRKLSNFLKPGWEYRDDKSIEEFEQEKREEFDDFIKSNDWQVTEKFLYSIHELYMQQVDSTAWRIENAVTDIYISIANHDKIYLEKALRLFFSGKVLFPLRTMVISTALINNIMTGKELLSIINDYDFKGKSYWISVLLTMLPAEQVNVVFLKILIDLFQKSENDIYVYRMLDYLKYEKSFEEYKKSKPDLENHNIITYLTSIVLSLPQKTRRDFGLHFCTECAPYFSEHLTLFKSAYLAQKETDQHFDYNGKELEAVLKMDSNFFIEILEQKAGRENYLTFKLENFKLDYIWSLPNYEDILNRAMDIIVTKSPIFSNWDHPATRLFTFQQSTDELQQKALKVLDNYLTKNVTDNQRVKTVFNIIVHRYNSQYIDFIKQLIILNKDVEILKQLHFDKGGVYSGSRVPRIQSEIDFSKKIIEMINDLPDTLSYSEHINYLEQKIGWLKKDIEREQRREFENEYY